MYKIIRLLFLLSLSLPDGILCQNNAQLNKGIEIKPGVLLDESEVTNEQYKQFVNWVRDSLMHSYLFHYYEDQKTGESYIDWEYEIDLSDPTLEDLYYQGFNRLEDKKELNISLFKYEYEIADEKKDASMDQSSFSQELYPTFREINIYPDTLIWVKYKDDYLTYSRHYFNNDVYAGYPVVGISFEQAQAYCHWRKKVLKFMLVKQNNKEKRVKIKSCRLPGSEDWMLAAKADISKKVARQIKEGKRNPESIYHFRSTGDLVAQGKIEQPYVKYFAIPAPVHSYPANADGFYHLWGNLAEMTNKKGVAKGGSWLDSGPKITVETEQLYKNPEVWLGFRCVCTCELN